MLRGSRIYASESVLGRGRHPSLHCVQPQLLPAVKPTLSSWPRAPGTCCRRAIWCPPCPLAQPFLMCIPSGVCRHLPLARDLVRVARQRLVFRLDAYCKRDNKLFSEVIK